MTMIKAKAMIIPCPQLKAKSRRGFTLAETVIALGMATVSMTAVFGILPVGLNSNQDSTEQTLASNVLTAIATDMRSTPNPTPKGSAQTSHFFKIRVPSTTSTEADRQTFYLTEDGQCTEDAASARYQLNVWIQPGPETNPAMVARALISWPATTSYKNSMGSVESLISLDRM